MIHKFFATALPLLFCVALLSCSSQRKLNKLAQKTLLQQQELSGAHVGISVMDAATGEYLFNYQGHKYFIPASNTKLLTCYAAMKYLGDSLEGLRYQLQPSGTILIQGTGDPSFLHPDFPAQPVYHFLKNKTVSYVEAEPETSFKPFGRGWAWDDYQDDYMAERSSFPIYGNCLLFNATAPAGKRVTPSRFLTPDLQLPDMAVHREKDSNHFYGVKNTGAGKRQWVPFKTIINRSPVYWQLLADTLRAPVTKYTATTPVGQLPQVIYSQPTDSLLKIMMYRSDNFFAEQSLLMVSNARLKMVGDNAIIDTLLSTDFAGMPQQPKWVDGSGLSRYNLISPQDFVWLLRKMKQEFSWQRITAILATGGKGTLSAYYKKYPGQIYAKTGTLSNNVSLSGFLITQKGKTLAFSVMVNNHKAAVANIRKEVEAFLETIIEKY